MYHVSATGVDERMINVHYHCRATYGSQFRLGSMEGMA